MKSELNRKYYQSAADLGKKALQYDPFDAEIYGDLATCCIQLGQEKDAQEYLQKAVELDTSNAEYLKMLHTFD